MISKTGQNGAHGRNSTSPVDDRFARSKVKRNSAGDESEDGDEDREYHSHRNGHSKGVGSDSDEEGILKNIFNVNQPFNISYICNNTPIKICIFIHFNIGDRVPPIGLHGSDPDNLSEVSASAANVTNDGKHPLLEFALRYFRDVQLLMEGASSSEGGGGKKGKRIFSTFTMSYLKKFEIATLVFLLSKHALMSKDFDDFPACSPIFTS